MIEVSVIPAGEITTRWQEVAEAIYPAIDHDPDFSFRLLRDRLIAGSAIAFEVSGTANGYWIVSLDEDSGRLVAWTVAIAGRISGGPKARVALMRQAAEALEKVLVNAGVTAHRICGRYWGRVLPDYQPYHGARNGLEKVL
jgi:hypothetical protein